jgi:alpha-ketoglutarate-dependent 2,4-dichlorophenoxyacetate dioxygenase
MSITVIAHSQTFVAEIGDIDLSRPLAPEDLAQVRDAFKTYAVVVFPGQELTVEQHMAFGANFGPLETTVQKSFREQKLRVREEIADVGNIESDGKLWAPDSRRRRFEMGNRLWHTDSSFKAPSAYASMLYARSVAPIGGHTQYADLRAAYDALPQPMKQRIEGLLAEHSLMFSRARLGFSDFTDDERTSFAPTVRPLARTLADSGRRSLYIASHIGRIRGMDDAAAKALVDELVAHATQPRFVYTHRWRLGDLVMWDNRCTMHRGTEYEDTRWKRDMHRVTTSDKLDAFGVPESAVRTTALSPEY